MMSVRNFIHTLLPLFPLLFGGIWRDLTGLSRPVMFFPLLGELLAVFITLAGSFFWKLSAWYLVIPEGIMSGILGSGLLYDLGFICHVTSLSPENEITFR